MDTEDRLKAAFARHDREVESKTDAESEAILRCLCAGGSTGRVGLLGICPVHNTKARRDAFEKCNAEGVLRAEWRAHPTAPRCIRMRVVILKELNDNPLCCSIDVRALTRSQAAKLRDEIDHAIQMIDKHLAEDTGLE